MSDSSYRNSRISKSICNMCTNRCGINVYVQNGKIVKIDGMQEHPFNHLCVKADAIPEMVHSGERLTNPIIKLRGVISAVDWEDAFNFVTHNLESIRRKYGPEALVVHLGSPVSTSPLARVMARRFTDVFGSPNFTTSSFTCFQVRGIASGLTCGTPPNAPDTHSVNSKCILVWGKNPGQTFPPEMDDIYAAVGRGAKLIVVDPRQIPIAKKSDIYAQIRPGTDCALALGLLNVILAEKLYDEDFVNRWTYGFDRLVDHVKEFSPDLVEKITWVPAHSVETIARMFASNKPSRIHPGVSLEHCSNGTQIFRALTIITAITGNLDIAGGNLIVPKLAYADLRVRQNVIQDVTIGDEYPLFTKYVNMPSASALTNSILNEKPYPIKALIVAGSNPLVTWPNSHLVKEAFGKLEMLVAVDNFMTETCEVADAVLPAATFLETDALRDLYFDHQGTPLIAFSKKVIQPIGECMEDWRIWLNLAKRMGYAKYFSWDSSDELISDLLKTTNITLKQLKENPGGVFYAEREYQKFSKTGFNTPSGKVEIFSEAMNQHGYDPMPTFHEPVESLVSRPDLAKEYPLILITGPRTIFFTNSRYRNLPTLRKLCTAPLIEINPETARSIGIADGDMVRVNTVRGSIAIEARLTEDIHPRVVSMLHGWSSDTGANANYLTDNSAVDPVSSFPEHKSILCRIMKA